MRIEIDKKNKVVYAMEPMSIIDFNKLANQHLEDISEWKIGSIVRIDQYVPPPTREMMEEDIFQFFRIHIN